VYPFALHPSVSFLIFTITVHSQGRNFTDVETASCHAWDGAGHEIVNYSVGAHGQQKAMVMAMLAKLQGVWYFYR
jgi:stress response protein SCP2